MAKKIIDAQSTDKFLAGYPQFTPKHRSLMAKLLTHDIYNDLKGRKTAIGYTLDQAIQTGVDNPHLMVGIVAGDEESYFTFKEIFDPVIEGWHGFKPDRVHKTDLDSFHIVDACLPDEFIISTRIRAGRSIRGMPLPPATSRSYRREVMNIIQSALSDMTGDLKGQFYKLSEMTSAEEKKLIDDHYLFKKPGSETLLAAAGATRDWPSGRGIFHNNEKTFLVWVNEEDHMRVISMQKGGDVGVVFERFCRAMKLLEKNIISKGKEFMYDDRHGFICTCPSNLGTSIRASVMIKLPQLSKNRDRFELICQLLQLQPRGSSGEHTESTKEIWDISNKQRIGHSETELVQTMINGVKLLIAMEQKLIVGESVDDMIPKEPVSPVYIPTAERIIGSETPIKIQSTMECNYPELTPKHKSLMVKYMTEELYEKLKGKTTSKGYTLDQAIQAGVDNAHLSVGIVAGDEECYEVFKELFDQVIIGWHGYNVADTHRSDMDATKLRNVERLDMNYITSIRICAVRNIRNLSLPPGISRFERMKVEKLIATALEAMTGEFTGQYFPLDGMTAAEKDQLQKDRLLFEKPGDGTLLAGTGAIHDWPSGRGIFHNDEKTFLVWVNKEDHMQVIYIENSGDIVKVFTRWAKCMKVVEESIRRTDYEFMYNDHLGFLSTCPSNVGTGLRASVLINFEKLGQDAHKLEKICQSLGLQSQDLSEEAGTDVGDMWVISNKMTIGLSEVELLQTLIDGMAKLIELEKAMHAGEVYDNIFQELSINTGP